MFSCTKNVHTSKERSLQPDQKSHCAICKDYEQNCNHDQEKMPMTAAERQAKCRAKLKESRENYAEHKKKNVQYQMKSRCKKKERELSLPNRDQKLIQEHRREETRKRVAKWRALRKQEAKDKGPAALIVPFGNAHVLDKAIYRARQALRPALPSTPRRKKAVCRELLRRTFDIDDQEPCYSPNQPVGHKPLSQETIDKVVEFYERDDISRQAPGRKDVINVRNEAGEKEKRQARHLTTSVKEAYALFCEEYPETKIGKSKFAELRPKHVLLLNKLPHNVCMCRYHENFIDAISALHKTCRDFPLYTYELPGKFLCAESTEQCWLNKCSECKDGKGFAIYFENHDVADDDIVTWYIWKNDENDKLCKAVEEGTVSELREYICSITPQFMEHCYIKRQQATRYTQEREAAMSTPNDGSKALLQVDYSENYSCSYQDEIQSAHWKQQVTLFTAVLWHSGELHSMVIASDNLTHAKETLVAYISRILDELPSTVTTVSLWSDGRVSQFKNRYVAAGMHALEQYHGIEIHWNFFATSHGKGPVDGIGGSMKRKVWTGVKARKFLVTNASSFVEAASADDASKVKVLEMAESEITQRNESLNLAHVFSNAPAIQGISGAHYLKISGGRAVSYTMSKDADSAADESGQNDDPDVEVKDWCLVEYDNELFPGEVVSKIGENYEVSVMVKSGGYWKWPAKEDKIFYTKDTIKKRLEVPIPVNRRGLYKFPGFPQ